MVFVVAPDFKIRAANWTLSRPAQVNVSGWTGRRTVVADPWHGKWAAEIDLAPLLEADARAMRAFFARCKGAIHTFRLYAAAVSQNDNFGVQVKVAAAAGAASVTLAGLTTAMLLGQMMTIAGQLVVVRDIGSLSAGDQLVEFEPPLRQSAAVGTKVVTARPYALVHLASSTAGWGIEPGVIYSMSFAVEEAILEADGTPPESELVANGTFTPDTSGWTPSANAVLSVVGGRMRVATNTTSPQYAGQAINLTFGMTYRLTADIFGLTGPATLRIGTAAGSSAGGGSALAARNTTGAADITFVAAANTVYISAWVDSAVANEYAEFDNISLRVAD